MGQFNNHYFTITCVFIKIVLKSRYHSYILQSKVSKHGFNRLIFITYLMETAMYKSAPSDRFVEIFKIILYSSYEIQCLYTYRYENIEAELQLHCEHSRISK